MSSVVLKDASWIGPRDQSPITEYLGIIFSLVTPPPISQQFVSFANIRPILKTSSYGPAGRVGKSKNCPVCTSHYILGSDEKRATMVMMTVAAAQSRANELVHCR